VDAAPYVKAGSSIVRIARGIDLKGLQKGEYQLQIRATVKSARNTLTGMHSIMEVTLVRSSIRSLFGQIVFARPMLNSSHLEIGGAKPCYQQLSGKATLRRRGIDISE
jgi:leucyl aminopeptidase (aminopeptidase T)